ncbi:MAG: dihydrofolate reductase family protein [Thermoanaerobacter sp.]|nr:dihydrofolate reductase family protein [Thermoanaerobacter sp.]
MIRVSLQRPTEFNVEEIKLILLFDNTQKMGYSKKFLECEKIEKVYGNLVFGETPADRALTYACFVMSIDGKIAFEDSHLGPLIARTNFLDPSGAKADYWILNMLRGISDGIIIGGGTLSEHPDYTGTIFDIDIVNARIKAGMPIAPWTIIVSNSGRRIPYKNRVFTDKEVPILINTSPEGFKNLEKEIIHPYFVIDHSDLSTVRKQVEDNKEKIAVLVTGTDSSSDGEILFKVLKAMGVEKVLVESPSYVHYLMGKGLLDEIFINTSAIFVGGKCASIGWNNEPFTSTNHPHAEVVSIHIHKANFIYTRYKLIYGIINKS